MKYLISHQGQESGPYSLEDLVLKVRSKELDVFDYVYDEGKQDWILLMDHPELAKSLRSPKPSHLVKPSRPILEVASAKPVAEPVLEQVAMPKVANASVHTIEWFVLKGEHRFGPFPYDEVVKMLQQKAVFPFDFIWHSGLQGWKRIAEMVEFSEGSIRQRLAQAKAKDGVFTARKHSRHRYAGRVIIHDNTSVWKGSGYEISKGGVGVTMTNALVVPGQQLYVHFSGNSEMPAFNAVCEVVSKKFVNDNTPIQYGLKFLSMSQDVQSEFNKKVV